LGVKEKIAFCSTAGFDARLELQLGPSSISIANAVESD
jgi:hypothetical protein